MRFCDHCDNMLYLRAEGDALVLHCKTCLYAEPATAEQLQTPVYENMRLGRDLEDAKFRAYLTPEIEHDPTLPRARGVRCPSSCPPDSDVVFVKYDAVELKFLYFCTSCKQFWRSAAAAAAT